MSTRRYSDPSATESIGHIVIYALRTAVMIIVVGFVLKMNWNWFIPHIFHGAPRLNIIEAAGVNLIVSFLVMHIPHNLEEAEETEDVFVWFVTLLVSAYFLLLGFILHFFL